MLKAFSVSRFDLSAQNNYLHTCLTARVDVYVTEYRAWASVEQLCCQQHITWYNFDNISPINTTSCSVSGKHGSKITAGKHFCTPLHTVAICRKTVV